jgi:hypothetical protein
MTLDTLNQALEEQKMCGVEKDIVEVIARIVGVSPAVAARMTFIMRCLPAHLGLYIQSWDEHLDTELQEAIKLATDNGLRRLLVRDAITRSGTVTIVAKHLFPAGGEPRRICTGCTRSLACIAEGVRTPERCLEEGAVVYPLRFVTPKQVEVECAHPAGRFVVPLKLFPTTSTGECYDREGNRFNF